MATYLLHEKAYLPTDRGIPMLFEAGSEVSVPDDLVPGPHMEPRCSTARKMFLERVDKKSGKFVSPPMSKIEDQPMAVFASFDFKKMMEEANAG